MLSTDSLSFFYHICIILSFIWWDLNGKDDKINIYSRAVQVSWIILVFQDLETVHGTGEKKLTELRKLGDKVSLSTSERGGKALKATVASMEDAWNQHIANVGEWDSFLM